jgi:histidinol phosphatase-like PHP family hydrolase
MNDYHIHLGVDECALPEMTFENIEEQAFQVGLKEICILKHYSLWLPNARANWVFWKRIKKEAFDDFITKIKLQKKSFRMKLFAGVETELVDCKGNINIPPEDAEKLDAIVLSVHWMPRLEILTPHPLLNPYQPDKTPPTLLEYWHEDVKKVGAKAILENFVKAYVVAIEQNSKLLVLGHMFDGMFPLRKYQIPVDEISDKTLCEIFTPLFKMCVERGVLWELSHSDSLPHPDLFAHANKLGVKFCATSDSHALEGIRTHIKVEQLLDKYGLQRGRLNVKG